MEGKLKISILSRESDSMFKPLKLSLKGGFWGLALLLIPALSMANVPGGGTGTGPNVTVTQSGTNVTLSNGIVTFTIDTSNANITNFTYDGTNLLAGGSGGGHFYIDGSGGPTFNNPTYTLTVNPADNGGNQAEVWLQQTGSPMDAAAYFDLNRGQQGFYDTVILTHQASYPDYPGAELRTNVYVGSIFDWLAVDPYRFRQMALPSDTTVAVPGAPKEVMQWTSGIYNGLTECKYAYSDPLGQLNVWGWASTTAPYGIWQTLPSHEFEDGGPMHRELTEHIGNTLLNMFGGGHYGFGLSQDQPAGTFSSKTFGPAFVYANKYAGSSSDPVSVKAQALWADAQAQAAAEQGAWPYTWFKPQPVAGMTGSAYPQASARGTVSGTFAINDSFNPNASPASMWIGLAPVDNGIDFQQQYLTCQFWVTTGANGAFTIPNVLPGTYNLWAFGPGAAGTFEQTNVTVPAGPLNLGTVTWTPPRLGPTVWEIGYPNRNSNKFNNGEHNISPYTGVLPGYAGGAPYDVPATWGAFMAYPAQYPNGVSFVVGTSNYATDWNYVQPTVASGSSFTGSSSTIYFNLASAPTSGAQARLYIAFAAVNSGACILTINGVVQTGSVMGSTDGNYAAIGNSTNGFTPPNHSFDTPLRLGSNGAWGDAYLDFPGTSLKAGLNEIEITMRSTGGASLGQGFEYDYLRLELSGYTASGSVTPTKTSTPIPPTATHTNTPVPPTSTFTSTPTNTVTSTRTDTPVPPTSTNTPVPPTVTNTSVPPTATNTFVPPTATGTNSPVPPTATNTLVPPTDTPTLVPTVTPTFTLTPTPISSGSGSMTLYLLSAVTTDSTNSPHPQIEVVNTGSGPLDLNNVEVRYWFNCDCTTQTVQSWVDWAGLLPAGTSVTGDVVNTVQPTTEGGQTNYVSYKFTGNLVLQPGQMIEIQSRFNKSDWSNMLQDNDWSFAPYTSFTQWTHITGYLNGSLVWGQEPSGSSAALKAASLIAYPNPSTGNGVNLAVNLSGNGGGASASVKAKDVTGSVEEVDPSAQVALKVYTIEGRLIWSTTLPASSFGSSGNHSVYWNEKDLSGANLANGIYVVAVVVKSQGQTSTAFSKVMILK
jgi:rhamnogalacturonan endolyase